MNSTTSVKVFINPTCGPCNELKKWLIKNKIHFIERDIINDVSSAKDFKSIGGKFTPTTIIETDTESFKVIGNSPYKILGILSKIKKQQSQKRNDFMTNESPIVSEIKKFNQIKIDLFNLSKCLEFCKDKQEKEEIFKKVLEYSVDLKNTKELLENEYQIKICKCMF
ncbi:MULTISPECIES: glutaredoxin family protein [unclassified Oceanobacillus]|uniref:glutaredoxin family protein n=1 Tax=unclassified Oceanobacillus TaxID=2630292 RepID=UPI00300DC9B7